MEKLKDYHWPGNIRELRNAIERAVIVADEPQITLKHLSIGSPERSQPTNTIPYQISNDGIDFKEIIDNISRELIMRALNQTGGNKSKTSRLLKIPRQVLLYQMKKLGIEG